MKKSYFFSPLILMAFSFTGCDKQQPQNPDENPGTGDVTVESISIYPSSLDMTIGDVKNLSLNIQPSDATGYTVVWSSSDEAIATVDNGSVTAIAEGTATITATIGEVSGESIITVSASGSDDPDDPDNPDNPDDPDDPDEPITPSDPAQIGDYFYSDGTWSPTLDPDRQVIGIVFWTGDPTAQDPILKKDHPECTNGLVVAANELDYITWQSRYEEFNEWVGNWIKDNTDDGYVYLCTRTDSYIADEQDRILGYNNTSGIKAFNKDPYCSQFPVEAVQAIEEFESTYYAAPSNTSGWYLPSIRELYIMYYKDSGKIAVYPVGVPQGSDTYTMLNSKFRQISGADIIGSDGLGFYMSSNEHFAALESVIAIAFNQQGTVAVTKKSSTTSKARYVLAF